MITNHIESNLKTAGSFCSLPNSTVLLKLTPDAKPSWVSQYTIKPYLKTVVDEQVKKWLNSGIIEFAPPGTSWNSSLIVVAKVNELDDNIKHRVCLDPRHINRLLMDDRYPIPRLREILDAATGYKFFSSLDLESSFHQLKLKESSSMITSFTWKNVHYRFISAPFGLKTLTSAFQRITSQLFYDMPNVFVFVDDILIVSSTFNEHLLLQDPPTRRPNCGKINAVF